ncbi:inosine-5'-monophosphate dehydrogenase [Mycoplasma sp. (ex Biomphalaria glabrata)]|nr:IMP dehydrogenase [Mycoplasma sp. (ex Biomphalaria glabrata)]ALV23327.1 inosine-5'-monophosphate dehydrogenase [Mycoplasma sp. (ex Biomphalaria glabrata)]
MENKKIELGLTFDDVLLVPQGSTIMPSSTSLQTKLTSDILLNIPIISSAMDTVTNSTLAIALARCGGIGIIHKNYSIEEQVKEVDRVKRSESGMITNPIYIQKGTTLKEADEIMGYYKISGLPIVSRDSMYLLGIITNRDIKYVEDFSEPVEKYMTPLDKLITAKTSIKLEDAKKILQKYKIEKLPLIDENGILKGLITSKDIDKAIQYPNACKDDKGRLRVGAAIGANEEAILRAESLVVAGVDVIVVDSAHGHSINVIETVKKLRKLFPKLNIIAGNIVTPEAAQELVEAGANAVKVGIGPGSICTTRVVTGVGVPQITAIKNVAKYCKERNIPIIADGGIKYSGDIVKALAIGASCVMLGSIFAGCHESPGEEIILDGRKFKIYAGMGSLAAMERGSKDRYFQEKNQKLVPEGIEGRIPFKGKLEDVVFQLTGGIRSGLGYIGASDIVELQKRAIFVQITNAGLKESHPHGIQITKEAPNYQNQD